MSSFMNEDEVKANITLWHMLKGLWPYAKKHPLLLTLSLISVFGVAVSSRLMPTIVGYAIDHGIQEKNVQILQKAGIYFLIAEITHVIFLFLYQYLFQWYGNRTLYYLREDLLKHTQDLPLNYFNKTPTGRIVTRVTNDISTLGEVFTDGIINVFTESVVLISIIISMAFISWRLTLATLFLAPVFIYLAYIISEKIRTILRESKKRLSNLNSFTAENLSGIKIVQLFNRVTKNRQKFAYLSRSYRDSLLDSIRHYALLQPIMNLFNATTITIALYYGGLLGTSGKADSLALGALVAYLMHVQDFIHPLREILDKYQSFQNSLTSAERIFHLLDEKKEQDLSSRESEQLESLKHFTGAIEFKNLSFQYEKSLPPALKNINITIRPGQSVALVGRTGSGKTTFVSLLQRFYDVPKNSIFIDDIPIENIHRKLLRARIGVVQQDNFIFRGTIRDNVNLGDQKISNQKIEEALKKVGYDNLLKRSGRTLDSHVEEKGLNLSTGERQLIAFARILAFEPDIFILDEATSNIDSESEKLIQTATKEVTKNRTSLIIAHRLSTIEECDKVITLDHGEIQAN